MENKFIKMADLPPDPTDHADLEKYKNLGMNVCLLTEDDVKLVSGGTVSQDYKKAIENIGSHGMQVWIRNMFNDPDYFECDAYKEGSNYGEEYEMEPRHITGEFEAFPQVTGFYMADEAYMYQLPREPVVEWMKPDSWQYASFDRLTKLVDWKNKYYPHAFWHMNHVPGQSWDHYLPRDGQIYDYEDFLTSYTEVILKRLKGCGRSLCLDNYPLIGKNYLEKDYLFDLMTAAKVTRKYNETAAPEDQATFGICLQTFDAKSMFDDRRRDITMPEEVTLQMYVGMALGARLFEYFSYRSYKREFFGILDPEKNNRIYSHVKTAGDRAAFYEPILSGFQSRGGYMVPGSQLSHNTAAMVMAKDLFCEPYEIRVRSQYDTLVGCLTADGCKAYMLVNYTDPIRQCTGKVTLEGGGVTQLRLYKDGREEVLTAEDGVFTVTLEPGNCAFVVW
ncbi:MAG: hypothetical protein J6B67_04295 [Oscillospiraceae bacterium]|nr:hypothetical protein [Oscillospiraceae bacterium]